MERNMELYIELYNENNLFCAYIGDNCGGSGYSIKADTKEERAEQIKDYILDCVD